MKKRTTKTFKFPCTKMKIVVVDDQVLPELQVTEPLNVGMVIDSMSGSELKRLTKHLINVLHLNQSSYKIPGPTHELVEVENTDPIPYGCTYMKKKHVLRKIDIRKH